MNKFFKDNESIVIYARELAQGLSRLGYEEEAIELMQVTDSCWTTSSELLGELSLKLASIRPIAETVLGAAAVAVGCPVQFIRIPMLKLSALTAAPPIYRARQTVKWAQSRSTLRQAQGERL